MKGWAIAFLVLVLAGCVMLVVLLTQRTDDALRARDGGSDVQASSGRDRRAFSGPRARIIRRSGPAALDEADDEQDVPGAIPGEYTYRFYDSRDLDRFAELARKHGVEVVDRIDLLRALRVRTDSMKRLVELLAVAPTPVESSRNFYVHYPRPVPAAPQAPDGVSYEPFGSNVGRWLGLPAKTGARGEGVTIAVLDTGVGAHAVLKDADIEHRDLVEKTGEDAATPSGHGTAVTSLIVGNSAEVAGLAPEADILDVRVMNAQGIGDTFTLARGILDAANAGAGVLNLCLGSIGDSGVLRDAIEYARAQGALVVAAAGNNGDEALLYPAAYPGVLAVTAVDAGSRRMFFANRGDALDLAAPGFGVSAAGPEDSVRPFSGTSAAVPLVSGAVAGLVSANPGMSPAEAARLLVMHADDEGAPGTDPEYGEGVMNLGRVFERDKPGVYDLTVVRPYARTHPLYPDEYLISIFAENRGTERLGGVTMALTVDGVPREVKFYDVAVGENVVYELRLTQAGIGERRVEIRQEMILDGADDVRPVDNVLRTVLRMAD